MCLLENRFARPHPSVHPKRRRYVEERLFPPPYPVLSDPISYPRCMLKQQTQRPHSSRLFPYRLSRACIVGLLGKWVGWSDLLNAQLRQPLTHVHALFQALALHDTCYKATCKCVASTVGVADALLVDLVHGKLLDLHVSRIAADCNDTGLGAVSDDCCSWTTSVALGQVGQRFGDRV